MVAVTGDDNSGGLTTTDTAATGGDVSVAGHQPGEDLAGIADTGYDDVIAERDVLPAEAEALSAPGIR